MMLGEAHYVRYDETTATRLLALVNKMNAEYHGKVSNIVEACADSKTFEKRLSELEGIEPKPLRFL